MMKRTNRAVFPNTQKAASLGMLLLLLVLMPGQSWALPDTIPPTGTVMINNGAQYTTSATVTLTTFATDTGSGVSQMRFSNTNSNPWSTPVSYGTTTTWMLSSMNGNKTVYAQFKDNAGNWSTATISDTIILDSDSPNGSITISSSTATINYSTVTLSLICQDSGSGCASMQFSNDNVTWSNPVSYVATTTWPLSSGDGTKTVYARFADNAGNTTSGRNITDSIILDMTVPETTAFPAGGAYSVSHQNVTLSVSEAAPIFYTTNNTTPTTASAQYANPIILASEATTTINFFAKDSAGNTEIVKTAVFMLDTVNPTGSVRINNGDQYTTSANVTLTLNCTDSGSGCSKMQFANDDPDTHNITWSNLVSYTTTTTWALRNGDGTKIVYALFQDKAGNWSNAHSASIQDSIILDATAPTTTANPSAGAYNQSNFNVSLTSSGATTIYYTKDGSMPTTASMVYTSPISLPTNSITTLRYFARDMVGNTESVKTGVYIVDRIAPAGSFTINNGAQYASNPTVTIISSPVDTLSGVYQMKFSEDNATWSAPVTFATTMTWTFSPDSYYGGQPRWSNGHRNFYARYMDFAGNWSTGTISAGISLDMDRPSQASISIVRNAGSSSGWTNNPVVTLSLSCQDADSGCAWMQFSNDNLIWSEPLSYSAGTTWTLSDGDGTKTVYARVIDAAGNVRTLDDRMQSLSDSVVLDSTPPITTASPAGGIYRSARHISLATNEDPSGYNFSPPRSSGTVTIYYTTSGSMPTIASSVYSSLSPILISSSGTTTLKYFAVDPAGNIEAVKTDVYLIDTRPPTGSFKINNGAMIATSPTVTLAITASDDSSGVALMKFSNDNMHWSTPATYATTTTWTLIPGDGAKTVYAKFSDFAGNWSPAYITATIILDATGPKTTVVNHTYDDQNRLIKSEYISDGSAIIYTYNKIGNRMTKSFQYKPHTLTVIIDGAGTVTSSPAARINNCSGNCQAKFSEGTTIRLTATPADGSVLTSWTIEGCDPTMPCEFVMSGDTDVTASFSSAPAP